MPLSFFLDNYIKYSMRKEKEKAKMQENLRNQVKLLKALQDVSYTEIAEHLEI